MAVTSEATTLWNGALAGFGTPPQSLEVTGTCPVSRALAGIPATLEANLA